MILGAERVNIVGAGPTGALLAILLQRRGLKVTVYDSGQDPRSSSGAFGRSINLALADRGIHALELAGVSDRIRGILIPMRGRLIHQIDGTRSLQPYGQRPSEVIYSVSRHCLSRALVEAAARQPGVEIKFEHRMVDTDFENGTARIRDTRLGRTFTIEMRPLLAAEGAASLTRRRMAASGLIDATETALDHGYKELSIPAGPNGGYQMASDALHVWPRGSFMLIALPNSDGSFTATLFLSKHGPSSFETLTSPSAIEHFLSGHFPDVHPLMADAVAEFQRNPTGFLGTVHATPWHVRGMAALVGDSAHAIVPFHGQGMNCCFEDCVEFDSCLERYAGWDAVFADFYAARKANTDAIAAMALENYLEMRERVVDPKFRLQQSLALELERRHPQRFIPRYSMVMFHHEIPYRTAFDRGLAQSRLLVELTADATSLAEVDYERAARAVDLELTPMSPDDAPR